MNRDHKYLKASIQHTLERANLYEWTIQGFGMLRLYVGKDNAFRLNVWDGNFQVPNVSLIHTHPWDFESVVVAGVVQNQRYIEDARDETRQAVLHSKAVIRPGIGGGLIDDDPIKVYLTALDPELIHEGEVYRQKAHEIHSSHPVTGTVTFNERKRVGDDLAWVYWTGEKWVTAEPRTATTDEVYQITQRALETWFR